MSSVSTRSALSMCPIPLWLLRAQPWPPEVKPLLLGACKSPLPLKTEQYTARMGLCFQSQHTRVDHQAGRRRGEESRAVMPAAAKGLQSISAGWKVGKGRGREG